MEDLRAVQFALKAQNLMDQKRKSEEWLSAVSGNYNSPRPIKRTMTNNFESAKELDKLSQSQTSLTGAPELKRQLPKNQPLYSSLSSLGDLPKIPEALKKGSHVNHTTDPWGNFSDQQLKLLSDDTGDDEGYYTDDFESDRETSDDDSRLDNLSPTFSELDMHEQTISSSIDALKKNERILQKELDGLLSQEQSKKAEEPSDHKLNETDIGLIYGTSPQIATEPDRAMKKALEQAKAENYSLGGPENYTLSTDGVDLKHQPVGTSLSFVQKALNQPHEEDKSTSLCLSLLTGEQNLSSTETNVENEKWPLGLDEMVNRMNIEREEFESRDKIQKSFLLEQSSLKKK